MPKLQGLLFWAVALSLGLRSNCQSPTATDMYCDAPTEYHCGCYPNGDASTPTPQPETPKPVSRGPPDFGCNTNGPDGTFIQCP
eukprot:g18882.t1